MGKSIEELLDIYRQVRVEMNAGDTYEFQTSIDLGILIGGKVSVIVPGGRESGSSRVEFDTLRAALMAMIEASRQRIVGSLDHLDNARKEKAELLKKIDQLVNQ